MKPRVSDAYFSSVKQCTMRSLTASLHLHKIHKIFHQLPAADSWGLGTNAQMLCLSRTLQSILKNLFPDGPSPFCHSLLIPIDRDGNMGLEELTITYQSPPHSQHFCLPHTKLKPHPNSTTSASMHPYKHPANSPATPQSSTPTPSSTTTACRILPIFTALICTSIPHTRTPIPAREGRSADPDPPNLMSLSRLALYMNTGAETAGEVWP